MEEGLAQTRQDFSELGLREGLWSLMVQLVELRIWMLWTEPAQG